MNDKIEYQLVFMYELNNKQDRTQGVRCIYRGKAGLDINRLRELFDDKGIFEI